MYNTIVLIRFCYIYLFFWNNSKPHAGLTQNLIRVSPYLRACASWLPQKRPYSTPIPSCFYKYHFGYAIQFSLKINLKKTQLMPHKFTFSFWSLSGLQVKSLSSLTTTLLHFLPILCILALLRHFRCFSSFLSIFHHLKDGNKNKKIM